MTQENRSAVFRAGESAQHKSTAIVTDGLLGTTESRLAPEPTVSATSGDELPVVTLVLVPEIASTP